MWKTALICLGALQIVFAAPHIKIPLKDITTSEHRILKHGYPAESHFVETSDGYLLNIFRIPYSPTLNNKESKRPAVLLQHGLFSCSESFLLNGPENALAYNFADAGFDVWLGNARGNIYSRNNTKLSTNHPYFWDFSWHEIGAIDIAAMIDYIIETTGEEQIYYVGHSQGGTMYFVLMSWRPEYNAKIKQAHLLAPAVFMGNTTDAFVHSLYPYVGEPGPATNLLASQEFLPNNPTISRILDTACGGDPTFPEYCEVLFLMWAGPDPGNMNTSILPQLVETHPAGISTSQGIHYIQSYVSNMFRRFDYGTKKNLKVYNQELPPDYPLEQITAATHIYYGLADSAVNHKDLKRLPDILPNLKLFYEIPDPSWGHLDFIFAMQVKEEINDPVIAKCLEHEATILENI